MTTETIGHVKIHGLELAYSEWAGEDSPLLILHGLSIQRNGVLTKTVLGTRHAFAYDARGHGDSERAPGAYRFVEFGSDAVAFLEQVVQQPAILVGHSLGGMTAIYAAANRPDLVKGAFLVDPALYAPEAGLRHLRETFTEIRRSAGKSIQELLNTGVAPGPAVSWSKLDPAAMDMALDGTMFDEWDTDELLSRIDCPVMLEYGERDLGSAIYPGELERAKSKLRNCIAVNMAATGHSPFLQQPEAFAALLNDFLKGF